MSQASNLDRLYARFSDTWSPQIVGELNGQQVKLVKLEGDKCPWHAHAEEDEMFLVLEGTLDIHLRGEVVPVAAGEFYIVRQGAEHRVVPRGQVKCLLFEPATTAHTGKIQAEITRLHLDRLID
jgi:mannose-6-phosphate isomerase-like protein (cupin superfamily)